ncbi:helix-turn-helix domain-containing protein [Streptomyces cyaneofuscatus]|nr:helix-turn-helix domain-containing protein [Streptomyces cyaneofuscatus]WOP07871.1 helix-turn-helix domain-containing protein [Streptomyces cyaneofuscatus]
MHAHRGGDGRAPARAAGGILVGHRETGPGGRLRGGVPSAAPAAGEGRRSSVRRTEAGMRRETGAGGPHAGSAGGPHAGSAGGSHAGSPGAEGLGAREALAQDDVAQDERWPAVLVAGAPKLSARLLTEVFGPLLALAPAERALLVGTLEAWLECGGSVGRAAVRLRCHRNTVFNRLRRLERLTSRSLSHPRELVETVLALEALRWEAGRG